MPVPLTAWAAGPPSSAALDTSHHHPERPLVSLFPFSRFQACILASRHDFKFLCCWPRVTHTEATVSSKTSDFIWGKSAEREDVVGWVLPLCTDSVWLQRCAAGHRSRAEKVWNVARGSVSSEYIRSCMVYHGSFTHGNSWSPRKDLMEWALPLCPFFTWSFPTQRS
jgi:hypothetical protein